MFKIATCQSYRMNRLPVFAVTKLMTSHLKQELRRMKADRAGERFKHAHERARQHPITSGWGRVLCFALALVCVAIGVVLVFIPGPAFVFFILAGALIATQWWKMACWLDQAEVALRRLWTRLKNKWSPASRS